MELWFTEKQTESLGITAKVRRTLVSKQTEYQHLAIIETEQFGRMLVLDGMVQTTVADEFVYHEMLAHVAMATHPCPKRVAVIGGGDGGVIREVIKHPGVEKAVLVEIDGEVIAQCKQHLPEIACGLDDKKVDVLIGDGIAHVQQAEDCYDVILIDSTEPVGAAIGLFSQPFYESCFRALTAHGVLVAQTESPFINQEIIRKSYSAIQSCFPVARLYLASVPTYPSGLWSFSIGSKQVDPLDVELESEMPFKTRYYNSAVHHSAFVLPQFVKELIG